MGNLPHNATEDELREIFADFGSILDLRVHSKPNNKGAIPSGRAPPNYGFITYENQGGVQNCLAAKVGLSIFRSKIQYSYGCASLIISTLFDFFLFLTLGIIQTEKERL